MKLPLSSLGLLFQDRPPMSDPTATARNARPRLPDRAAG